MTAPGWRSLVPSRPKSAPILVSWDQYNSLWVNSCPHLCRVWTPCLKSVAIFWEFGIYTCIIMKTMVSQKSFGTDIDQNVDLVTSQSAFEQIFFTVSSLKSRSLQMFESDCSISFWAKQDHSWIWFWIWQFQAFLCLAGLGLGDIERKAIYFNQGLPAQLLTIVGWMGAINKTYGPLPQQLASTSKPVAARRQHGCRRAADHCLFLRLELRIDVHGKISNPTAKSSVTTDQLAGRTSPPKPLSPGPKMGILLYKLWRKTVEVYGSTKRI